MEFRVLGSFEVVAGERVLALGGAQRRAVLAALALHAPDPVAVDQLIDELWGESAPATAAHAIQVHVSAIRKILRAGASGNGTTVRTSASGYALAVEAEQIDARRFEGLIHQGQQALADDAAVSRQRFEEALALWRGPPLADLRGSEFAEREAQRLEDLRTLAAEGLVEARLASGEDAELIATITDLVAANPLRERPRRLLMLALYRNGRHAEALAAYRDGCRALDEIGLQPGPELRKLEQAILRHDPSLDVRSTDAGGRAPDIREATVTGPPPAGTTTGRSNLPAAVHALVGRKTELAEALGLLGRTDVRLVTLLGPGGSGKTRLALEIATRLEQRYRDGACFVSLAPLTDPTLIVSEIARAVGVYEAEGQPLADTLTAALARRELVLVLDNFEHLIAAAPLVGQLLAACSRLDVLVTSRAALRLSGEHRIEVPPLPLRDAAELFLARARAVRQDSAVGAPERAAVERICRRLDGLPLALELAAARIALFSVRVLDMRLAQRLELPEGARDLPDRHRTLRATIDWSYRLLSPAERVMFRGLGPFTGGARLEAIESIFANLDAAPVETVAALLDQSLLRRRDDPDGQPRFWMLDTIRDHALERLRVDGEADAAATRHAAYFAQFAVRADRHMHTADQRSWLQQLAADHDNLRAAFDHLLIAEPSEALRLGAALGFFWEIRGHISEGRERLRRALSAVSAYGAPAAKATYFAGRFAFLQGENERATPLFREALRLAREADEVEPHVQAMTHLGILTERRGDHGRGVELLEQALAIARGGTNDWALRVALNNLGTLLAEIGQTERAQTMLDEALLLARRLGEPFGLALTAGNLAELALARGDTHAAEALIAECLDSARDIDYASSIGWALSLHTLLALHRGELDTAEARNQEALKSLCVGYDASTGPIALAAGATLAAARREPLLAARLWAALDRDIRTHHVEEAWLIIQIRDEWLPKTRNAVDPAAWDAAWDAGATLTPEQALELQTRT